MEEDTDAGVQHSLETEQVAKLRELLNEDLGAGIDPDWPLVAGKRFAIASAAIEAFELARPPVQPVVGRVADA